MLTYTGLRNLYGDLTNDDSSANLTLGDTLINQAQKKILGMHDWYFMYSSDTATTTADTQEYQLPNDLQKLVSVTVSDGTNAYPVQEITSMEQWNNINTNSPSTDYPSYFYIIGNTINFYPYTNASDTITYYYKKRVKDLANADYTTGTVTLTNASAAVAGSGTTFTAGMVGRYLKGDDDGFWYEITSYTSATAITLTKVFQGTTGSGLSYTIGEMPAIPEEYHNLLVYDATANYYLSKDEPTRADRYISMFESGLSRMMKEYGSKTTNPRITSGKMHIQNPNLFVKY